MVFVHVPKSGGTALTQWLRDNGLAVRDLPNFFRGNGGARVVDLPAVPEGEHAAGHVPLSAVREAYPDHRTATVFRDPVERMVSHYYMLAHDSLTMRGQKRPYAGRPMHELVDEAVLLDNLYVRMLSDRNPTEAVAGRVTWRWLDEAVMNLPDLSWVGKAAALEFEIPPQRVHKERPRGREVPDEVMALAYRFTYYDRCLFGFTGGGASTGRLLELSRAGPT